MPFAPLRSLFDFAVRLYMKWTDKPEPDGLEEQLAWMFPPATTRDPAAWDDYWRKQFEHELMTVRLADMMNNPDDVIAAMRANGLRTVLCIATGSRLNPRTTSTPASRSPCSTSPRSR